MFELTLHRISGAGRRDPKTLTFKKGDFSLTPSKTKNMLIDHIGIVVSSLEEGVQQWQDLFGYKRNSEVVLNSRQKANVVFLFKPGSLPIKLVEPTGPDCPVYRFARKGGGLHHLCFRCEDLKVEVPLLKQKGAMFVARPQPGEAFNNREIAFFLAKNNLNVELIDTLEKRGWSGR